MSAFVVEDKTINKIVTYLAYARNIEYLHRKLINLNAAYKLDTLEGKQALGWDMFKLNVRAVNQRYEDKPADSFRPLNYQFRLEESGRIGVLKSLQCWLYQCSEGDCPENELFKIMEIIKNEIACDIVRDTKEYEMSSWG